MVAEGEQLEPQPQHTAVEEEEVLPELAKQAEEDDEEEQEEGDVSLLITEFDSDENPNEDALREVEEEEDEGSDIPSALGTSASQCCSVTALAAIKQAFQDWASYNAERKQMLETLREAYKFARANCIADFS